MKTVYLHTGLHKTGTTSIQRALCILQNDLRTLGVQYPQTGIPRIGNSPRNDFTNTLNGHHLLAWSIVDRTRISTSLLREHADQMTPDLWELLREELILSDAPSAVLSSEDFEWIDNEGVIQLMNRLEGFEIIPVMYFRNPLGYMVSMYKELLNTAQFAGSFGRFVREYNDLCSYYDRVDVWQRNGVQCIIIRCFDKVAREGDLVRDFIKIIGAENISTLLVKEIRENISICSEAIKVISWTNRVLMKVLREEGTRRINHWINRMLVSSQSTRRLVSLLFSGDPAQPEDLDWFRNSIRTEMDTFCKDFIPLEDRKYLMV